MSAFIFKSRQLVIFMDTTRKQQVLDLARKYVLIRPVDVARAGLPREYLSRLVDEGKLERLGRGLYQSPDREMGQYFSLLTVAKQVPNGVIALLSALSYHGFTTQHPHEVWIAIDRKARKAKMDYPRVRYLSMSGLALAEGVEEHVIDGVNVKVFNAAKTVADCFKYRNKIGLDVALEALREGWREKRFSMDELSHYAQICRVLNVMRPYMESLV
jgi:predicted transcriptional regulator of viral defense system